MSTFTVHSENGGGLAQHSHIDIGTDGTVTIADGNKIHPEYSAYLETIFETKDIVGRDLMDIVFSNTNLGADTLSQIEAVGGACIGEDIMNFEFNQHLMVGEIEKVMCSDDFKKSHSQSTVNALCLNP